MKSRILLACLLIAALPALLPAGTAFADASLVVAPDRAGAPARIVVPARDILRGEVIGDSDLTIKPAPSGALAAGTITRLDALIGMQARRSLRAGESLTLEDVRRPVVVTKGQIVTMSFSAPGVELTAMGRAMSEGGVGDTVTVQNPVSFRMVTATVTGPGAVQANPALPALVTTARK